MSWNWHSEKMCNVAHFLLVISQEMMKAAFRQRSNVTHFPLLVIEQDEEGAVWLPLGRKVWNITHPLLVIEEDVMSLQWLIWNVAHFLLAISQEVMRLHSEKVEYHSLSVGHRTGWGCYEMTIQQNVECYSPSVGHRKGCLKASKMSNVTHSLAQSGS